MALFPCYLLLAYLQEQFLIAIDLIRLHDLTLPVLEDCDTSPPTFYKKLVTYVKKVIKALRNKRPFFFKPTKKHQSWSSNNRQFVSKTIQMS